MSKDNDTLLDLLVEDEHITASMRDMLTHYMQTWQVSAFHALLMTEVIDEAELADALAASLGIDRLFQVRSLPLAEEASVKIGFARAREWECLALQSESGRIDLVAADPTRIDRIALLRRELACELTLAVAERSDIVGAIDELFPLSSQLPSLFGQVTVKP